MLTAAEIVGGQTRFEAISGLYRNTRQDDYFWFAFRRPADWVQLDAPTRSNGGLFLGSAAARKGLLLVAGAVALETSQGRPGHRRLHAMVQHGMTWPGSPNSTEPAVWEGREAVRCRWEVEGEVEAIFDLVSGVVLRTEWPNEVVELTGLAFDTQVDQTVFEPPAQRITGWRGGTASIVRSSAGGAITSSWEPRSGPGRLNIPGPKDATFEEALSWAQERTDDVHISEEGVCP